MALINGNTYNNFYDRPYLDATTDMYMFIYHKNEIIENFKNRKYGASHRSCSIYILTHQFAELRKTLYDEYEKIINLLVVDNKIKLKQGLMTCRFCNHILHYDCDCVNCKKKDIYKECDRVDLNAKIEILNKKLPYDISNYILEFKIV